MLTVDLGLTRIAATRESVLALHESINMPLVTIRNIGTAPTQAFVLGVRNDAGSYSVMVVLRQSDNDANLVYVSDPRTLNAEQYRYEEAEGLRFVESMGFLMNDHGYRALAPERQKELLERTPIFVGAKVERTVDLVDVEEESGGGRDDFEPDAIFGGLENVPMLKGQPESPPSFVPTARATAPTQRPTAPAPAGLRPSAPAPASMGSGTSPRPGHAAPLGGAGLTAGLGGLGGAGPATGSGGLGASAGLGTGAAAGLGASQGLGLGASQGLGIGASQGLGLGASQGLGLGSSQGLGLGATRPQPSLASAPAAAPAATVDAGALARLGRFLSTFAVVLALGLGAFRCVHQPAAGPDQELDPATQNQLDIAEHFLSQGEWTQAVTAFQPVLEAAPNNAIVRHGLALAYMYLERTELAEESFEKAIALDPQYSTAKNSLATLYLQQSRCEEAAKLLTEVLQDIVYPTPEFAQDNLARAEHCLGKSADAIKRLQKLVVSKPQFCRAYLTMADIATAARVPEATIRACDDFSNRCEMHEQIGKLVSPENRALCYLRKGMAQAALGDIEAAQQSLARCDSTGTFGRQCKASLELLQRGTWEQGVDE